MPSADQHVIQAIAGKEGKPGIAEHFFMEQGDENKGKELANALTKAQTMLFVFLLLIAKVWRSVRHDEEENPLPTRDPCGR